MFGKLAATVGDAVGTGQGDNCHILDPNEFAKETLLLSYVLPEEKVYVLLKSPREEYIFTDRAFISVKGDSSIGTKKIVQRFEFNEHRVASVRLQTPGYSGTDLDGELYFRLGGYEISIDIRKPEWENVKTIYKTLIRLAEKQTRDATSLKFFQETIAKAWLQTADGKALKELAFSASAEAYDRFLPISYRDNHQIFRRNHSMENFSNTKLFLESHLFSELLIPRLRRWR